jgi:hypothetical protein
MGRASSLVWRLHRSGRDSPGGLSSRAPVFGMNAPSRRPGQPAAAWPFLSGPHKACRPAARQGTNVLQEAGPCRPSWGRKPVQEYYGTQASLGDRRGLRGWRSRSHATRLERPFFPPRTDGREAASQPELARRRPGSRPSTEWACPREGAARARGGASFVGGRPHARDTQAAPPAHQGSA